MTLARTAGSTRRQPTTTPHHPPSPSSRLARTFPSATFSLLRRMILERCSAGLWWVSTSISTAALESHPETTSDSTLTLTLTLTRATRFARSPGHQVGFRPGGQRRHRTAAPGQHVAVESRAGGARDDQDAAVRAWVGEAQRMDGWGGQLLLGVPSCCISPSSTRLLSTRSPRPAHPDPLAASITACR